MSIMEIPDTLYQRLRDQHVAQLVGMGFSLGAARERATMAMEKAFVARSTAMQREYQEDITEEAESYRIKPRDILTKWNP